MFAELAIGNTSFSFLSSVMHSSAACAGATSKARRSFSVSVAGKASPPSSNNPRRSFKVKIRRTLRSMRASEIAPSSTSSFNNTGNSQSCGTMLMSMPARMAMRMASLCVAATLCRDFK